MKYIGLELHIDRNKRSKAFIKSELEQIKGIGKNSAPELIQEYKSEKKIKEATLEQLTASLGPAKAKILANYFNQTQKLFIYKMLNKLKFRKAEKKTKALLTVILLFVGMQISQAQYTDSRQKHT